MDVDSRENKINVLKGFFSDIEISKEGTSSSHPTIILLEWEEMLKRLGATFLNETSLQELDMCFGSFQRISSSEEECEKLKCKPIGDICKVSTDDGVFFIYTTQTDLVRQTILHF